MLLISQEESIWRCNGSPISGTLSCFLQDQLFVWDRTIQVDGVIATSTSCESISHLLYSQVKEAHEPMTIALKITHSAQSTIIAGAFITTTSATTKTIHVAEFIDDPCFYANTVSFLVQSRATHVILLDNTSSPKLVALLERNPNLVITVAKSKDSNCVQDLTRLCSDDAIGTSPLLDFALAVLCCSALILHLDLLAHSSNHGAFTLCQFHLRQFVKLDSTAIAALNLFPAATVVAAAASSSSALRATSLSVKSHSSVFGIINSHCQTVQGSQLLFQYMHQPLIDRQQITARLDIVQFFSENSVLRDTIHQEFLNTFPDLLRLGRKFGTFGSAKCSAGLVDVVLLYQVVQRLPRCLEIMHFHTESGNVLNRNFQTHFSAMLGEYVDNLRGFCDLVETTVDLDAASTGDPHSTMYTIKPDFDDSLANIKSEIDRLWTLIQEHALECAGTLDLEFGKKCKLEHGAATAGGMWHLRVSRADSTRIRGSSRGSSARYIELGTLKSGVLFTTETLREYAMQYRDLGLQYESMQANVVREIVDVCATYFGVLEMVNLWVARLDCMIAFSLTAVLAPIPYTRPIFNDAPATNPLRNKDDAPDNKDDDDDDSSVLLLKGARHPCLEMQDEISFIENSVEMKSRESSFQIITGPNMGGKSTYIRCIGVIAHLAQMGAYIPCDAGSQLPLFDAIFARVGAGDVQLKGVSTFMAEMIETCTLLRQATASSLVIIDELGRGTSTHDGFGLAFSIAEYVFFIYIYRYIAREIQSFTLFATHFHELTVLASRLPNVVNKHVRVHCSNNEILLLYKIADGVCDQSFGIHVAAIAKFPAAVVQLAKRKADELESGSIDRSEGAEQCRAVVCAGIQELKGLGLIHTMGDIELVDAIAAFRSRFLANVDPSVGLVLRELGCC